MQTMYCMDMPFSLHEHGIPKRTRKEQPSFYRVLRQILKWALNEALRGASARSSITCRARMGFTQHMSKVIPRDPPQSTTLELINISRPYPSLSPDLLEPSKPNEIEAKDQLALLDYLGVQKALLLGPGLEGSLAQRGKP